MHAIKTLLHRLTAIEVYFFIIRVSLVFVFGEKSISTMGYALLPEHVADSIES